MEKISFKVSPLELLVALGLANPVLLEEDPEEDIQEDEGPWEGFYGDYER